MGILAIKVLAIWSLLALGMGVALGAVIDKAERLQKDEFLMAVFANPGKSASPPLGKFNPASQITPRSFSNSLSPARTIFGFAVLNGSSPGMRSSQR